MKKKVELFISDNIEKGNKLYVQFIIILPDLKRDCKIFDTHTISTDRHEVKLYLMEQEGYSDILNKIFWI